MNKVLYIILISIFSLTVISCSSSSDSGSSATTSTTDDNTTTTTTTTGTTTTTSDAFGNAQFGYVKFQQKRNYEENIYNCNFFHLQHFTC